MATMPTADDALLAEALATEAERLSTMASGRASHVEGMASDDPARPYHEEVLRRARVSADILQTRWGGAVQARPRLESARFQKFNLTKRSLLLTLT